MVHSFSARVRLKFSSSDMSQNYMQWIGKPQLRLSLEPIIGNDFDLKMMLPPVKRLIDDSIA